MVQAAASAASHKMKVNCTLDLAYNLSVTPLLLTLLFFPAPKTDPIDYSAVWAKTAQTIQRSYYGRVSRKEEMDDRLKKYGPLASASHTKAEFRDTLDKMIGEFKDSHFDFLTDEDQGYYLMDGLAKKEPASMPEFGAWFKRAGDGYTVQMVLEGTEAEKAGLHKGDLITTVDGQPFSPVEGLKPDIGKTATLEIKRGSQMMEKKVTVVAEPALQMFLDATTESERIITSGKHKIGYVHLWTQANDKFAAALASLVYNKLKDTDAMILDLRDGFGGRPEGYGDPFFRPQVELDWKSTSFTQHQLFGYQRPLVVLINGGSRSAKEVLSFIFKKSKRATLIGSNTAGNVLGTFPARVSDWAYLEVPIVEVFADGVRLEGKGVAPDISVAREFDDSGKDLYIQTAVDFLSKKL